MDFLLANWYLVVVAILSALFLFMPKLKGGGVAGISPSAAVNLINREKAQIIDICSAEEFQRGHLPQAKHIPLAELESKLAGAVKNKQLPLILTCASGIRSARGVAVAKKLGYEKAYSLSGGLSAWRAANYPVETGRK